MKRKYWWALAAVIAVVVGVNMCADDRSHPQSEPAHPEPRLTPKPR